MKLLGRVFAASAALILCAAIAVAADDKQKKDKTPQVYPCRGISVPGAGTRRKRPREQSQRLALRQVGGRPALMLVEREDIKKLLDEQELNLSGLVNPQQAPRPANLPAPSC